MAATYIPPTVKQFVDGAMVAFFDASAWSALEAIFEGPGQSATSPVSNQTIVNLGVAFASSPALQGNISVDIDTIALNLTGSVITVPGEKAAFLAAFSGAQSYVQTVLGLDPTTGVGYKPAEGIVAAEFTASILGAQANQLGLLPADLTAFQIQQNTALNRTAVSSFYAGSATPGSTLVPQAIGDAAWTAAQNALSGVTNDPATVTTQEAKITAAEAVTPNNPALITPLAPTFNLTPGVDTFSTSAAGAVFNALPAAGTVEQTNTLNTGDTLTDTNGDGTLNVTNVFATAGVAANGPFATGVTMSGISTLNISNQAVSSAFGITLTAGFKGSVTGLTTANDNASLGGVQLGSAAQGLLSSAAKYNALANVNINGYAGPTGATPVFAAFINAAAPGVSTGANTINVNIEDALGTTAAAAKAAGAAILQFANDSGTPGTAAAPDTTFGTWAIAAANTVNLELVQGAVIGTFKAPVTDVGGAKTLTLSGAGNIAAGQDTAGNWQQLTAIGASTTTGNVVITGASAGNATNAFATAANPGWLFGSTAGLLNDTGTGGVFDLTSVKLGAGQMILDVSSATAAQIAALTTTPAATVAAGSEIIVSDGALAGASAATFKNIAGFDILGVTAAGGTAGETYDMSLLPASFDEILYQTLATGPVTITNQTNPLTVNTEDNGSGFALTSTGTGFTDSFNLIIGNPLHTGTGGLSDGSGAAGALTLTADSIVNITATSGVPATALDKLGFVSLTPAVSGNEAVTIGGDTALNIGLSGTSGAIADFNPTTTGALNPFNLTLVDTNSSAVTLAGATAGPLSFATGTGGTAPAIGYSTNAVTIDASKAAGALVMLAGDANFAGTTGDTIKGGTGAGNYLGGSLGNDTIVSNSAAGGDFIYTDGGADTITLAAGHTGTDTIGLYAGNNGSTPPAGAPIASVGGAIESDNGSGTESFNPGWFGLSAASASSTTPIAPGTGTAASLSTIYNFGGGDIVAFSVSAWGTGYGLHAANNGLTDGTMTTITSPVALTAANVVNVGSSGTFNIDTAGVDLIVFGGSYTDANALAYTLATGGIILDHGTLGGLRNTGQSNLLIEWQDQGGSVHLSDLQLTGSGFAGSRSTLTDQIRISDMVQLVGVSETAFHPGNLHIVA